MNEGRELVCTVCSEYVLVYEEPVEFIDPLLYVCGDCLLHRASPEAEQLSLEVPNTRAETRRYDPNYAEIPY